MKNDEMDNFIDDSNQQRESVSFYKQLESPNRIRDPQNLNDYPKFLNQSRDPCVAIYEDDELFYRTCNAQSELYAPENKESVEFDNFVGYEKNVKKFKEALKNFHGNDNPFFDSIIYALMFYLTEEKILIRIRQRKLLVMNFILNFWK